MKPFVRVLDEIDPQLVADLIVNEAIKNMTNEQFKSPFARKAEKFVIDYYGGRPDDATCIVAQII